MDYKRIITDGYDGRQTTPYAAYFKQQAQIAKRDNFVEFVVFFNGCKTIINNCKNDIQSKYNEELSNYDYFIRLAKQGQARDNNGNLIIDAKELEKRIAQLENQRQDIFDMGINSNYRITIEVLQPDPQKRDGKEYLTAGYTFDIYDLTDISNGLLQAEQELTTAKQSESAKQLESNTNKENTDQPKRTIDSEKLKQCFTNEYKGIAIKKSDNHTNFYAELEKRLSTMELSQKAVAEFAYYIRKSEYAISKVKGADFKDWYNDFCTMIGEEANADYQKESKCGMPSRGTKQILGILQLL